MLRKALCSLWVSRDLRDRRNRGAGLPADHPPAPLPEDLLLSRGSESRSRATGSSTRSPGQARNFGPGLCPPRQVRLPSHPTARLLKDLRLLGLPLSQGTVTDGLRCLSPFLEPLYRAFVARSRTASLSQADETRTLVFLPSEGKTNFKWWLWILLTSDTTVFVVDPTRSAAVPLEHFSGRAGILVVDRYSAYKSMARQVPGMILAFCWAHVRRDFIVALAKRPDRKGWASDWLSASERSTASRKIRRIGVPTMARFGNISPSCAPGPNRNGTTRAFRQNAANR